MIPGSYISGPDTLQGGQNSPYCGCQNKVEITTLLRLKKNKPLEVSYPQPYCIVLMISNVYFEINLFYFYYIFYYFIITIFITESLSLFAFQKSFFARLTDDKNSEKFFKVFNDRMREAQAEIKNTVSVNTGDTLGMAKPEGDTKDTATKEGEEKKKKGTHI